MLTRSWVGPVRRRVPAASSHTGRLARLRKVKSLTQKELAELVGFNQAQIHRYEEGAGEPSMSALKRLALGSRGHH